MQQLDARKIFESIDRTTIEAWIDKRQEENLHLDFKTLTGASMTGADDKKNLAKAISGFANSDGGLIVWGVEAKKGDDKIDCAQSVVAVANVPQLVSRLNALTGDCISPIVDGIKHKAVMFQGTSGCVITYVPQSSSGPHMAKLGEDRYYKRSGDSFYKMEHFDLEDMFGRRQKPNLGMIMVFENNCDTNINKLKFSMQNVGRKIAKHSGMIAKFPSDLIVINIEGPLRDISSLNDGRPVISFTDDQAVIHPNNVVMNIGSFTFSREIKNEPLEFDVKIFCDEMMCEDHSVAIFPDGSIVDKIVNGSTW